MTSDEKLDIKKDTWWEIHECEQTIACLERQINASLQAMESIVNVWKSEELISVSEHLVHYNKKFQAQNHLKEYLGYADLNKLVADLEETKKHRKSLKDSFRPNVIMKTGRCYD